MPMYETRENSQLWLRSLPDEHGWFTLISKENQKILTSSMGYEMGSEIKTQIKGNV